MATLFARILPRLPAAATVGEPLAEIEHAVAGPTIEDDEIRRMVELSGMVWFEPEVAVEN